MDRRKEAAAVQGRFVFPSRRLLAAGALCASLAAPAGCNPFTTRTPNLGPLPPPFIEGPSQERFDPFPDEDLGPDTFTRPIDYQIGRDENRTLLENRTAPRPPASQNPLDMFPGNGGLYPNVVQ
ncbi:MAG: hypothetical protein AAF907_08870 [Planctomycetota bacterium]